MSQFKCPNCQCQLSVFGATSAARQESVDSSEVGALLAKIEDAIMFGAKLDEWNTTFYNDLKTRFDKYDGDVRMTPKQMTILKRIADNAGIE